MGSTKFSFKRYEKKYIISEETYRPFMDELRPYLEHDEYYSSTVCSIYYDSDDYSLIRSSIEKPVYKEKLRLRSYNVPQAQDMVFVELKKKFKGIVYKRRVNMSSVDAERYLAGEIEAPESSQMTHEIDWFLRSNPVSPKIFIACDRTAYIAKDNPELRITFDRNLRWRDTELSLRAGSQGTALLPEDEMIMEIKIPGAVPLYLAELLSRYEIFPSSFSKYGSCYVKNILQRYMDGVEV